MAQPLQHHHISYIEFTATDVPRVKEFYSRVFGWTFEDWGPDYTCFNAQSAGMNGGFSKAKAGASASAAGPLIVLYSADLKATEDAVIAAGGSIVVPTFDFPGGRRFHLSDGAGNILAVWSE